MGQLPRCARAGLLPGAPALPNTASLSSLPCPAHPCPASLSSWTYDCQPSGYALALSAAGSALLILTLLVYFMYLSVAWRELGRRSYAHYRTNNVMLRLQVGRAVGREGSSEARALSLHQPTLPCGLSSPAPSPTRLPAPVLHARLDRPVHGALNRALLVRCTIGSRGSARSA